MHSINLDDIILAGFQHLRYSSNIVCILQFTCLNIIGQKIFTYFGVVQRKHPEMLRFFRRCLGIEI